MYVFIYIYIYVDNRYREIMHVENMSDIGLHFSTCFFFLFSTALEYDSLLLISRQKVTSLWEP